MASNPDFSLLDPNQQGWMQQGQSGVMAPYQAPAYQPPPIDWGMNNYLNGAPGGGLNASALNFGGNGSGFAPNQTGKFSMNWGNAQRTFGLANAALSTVGLIQGILQNRKDAKLRKNSAQRSFNANAILANNQMRARENAGTAFAAAHGIDYSGPTQPMKRIGGWGKSGEGVGT